MLLLLMMMMSFQEAVAGLPAAVAGMLTAVAGLQAAVGGLHVAVEHNLLHYSIFSCSQQFVPHNKKKRIVFALC